MVFFKDFGHGFVKGFTAPFKIAGKAVTGIAGAGASIVGAGASAVGSVGGSLLQVPGQLIGGVFSGLTGMGGSGGGGFSLTFLLVVGVAAFVILR
jgi:hypothetical protein